jgi:hypothetical protein
LIEIIAPSKVSIDPIEINCNAIATSVRKKKIKDAFEREKLF